MKLEIIEEKCWGCLTCEAACKQENGPPEGVKLIHIREDGPRQINDKWHFVFRARRCLHCDEPPCTSACPAGALEKRRDGIVILDGSRCNGCGACLAACPHTAIAFNQGATVAVKCNLCHHRLDQGLLPACADNICPAHAIYLIQDGKKQD